MGDSAFERCSSLESVIIPGILKVVPMNAFSDCDEITEVTVKPGVESIQA